MKSPEVAVLCGLEMRVEDVAVGRMESGNMEGKGATTDKEGHYYNKPGGLFTGNKDL